MNTSDVSILKQFRTVLNRKKLSQEVFDHLLKMWDLDGIDLEAEQLKIVQKKSNLSRSRRDAVVEFLKLKEMLKQDEVAVQSLSMSNSDDTIAQDTLNIN